ncbi:haloacid dehalogenase type II [Jiella pacifica]|uniref:Haloacid dehalogenase type II n=1 Tax=Jiella pacifica TaxID=2696469 RepID=A0A6N9T404_9HYPH|nr:haloacid dehalogenase type II [Jiella pacifica]NDW05991.1 haloacid dehalogenase type II [Jiella pacifica]
MKLTDFKALTFDCYGTLIDWETGIFTALQPLLDKLGTEMPRDRVLERHAVHESSQQAQTPAMPYSRLLATVHRRLSEEWGVPATWDECLAYGNSVPDWPAFPDTAEALAYLKQHYKLVILSNVDNRSFAGSNARLGVEFDAIYTAEDVGSYKPAPRNFDYMLEKLSGLGVAKGDILHTAESMFHDHQPANKAGLTSAWIYRRHGKEGFGATMNPGEMPSYAFRFTSMAELAEAHRKELG